MKLHVVDGNKCIRLKFNKVNDGFLSISIKMKTTESQ